MFESLGLHKNKKQELCNETETNMKHLESGGRVLLYIKNKLRGTKRKRASIASCSLCCS
jgi:hypothetical protein